MIKLSLVLGMQLPEKYKQNFNVFSGNDACDVTLSVYPHRASLKNMPDHGGNRTYDLWNTSPILASYSPEYITPTQKNHDYY
jgi:hypothetical protein